MSLQVNVCVLFHIDVQYISAVFLELHYYKELQLNSSILTITCT